MEENIIARGKSLKTNILIIIFGGLAMVLALMGLFWLAEYNRLPYELRYNEVGNFGAEYLTYTIIFCVISVILVVMAILSYLIMSNCEIIVFDKRVSGKIKFGIRVDLPLNQISSVGLGWFKSLTVATSSGVIRFWMLENRQELLSSINNLLSQSQNSQNFVSEKSKFSTADELKKFKELLDMGVITQEEFNAKKKELLGL